MLGEIYVYTITTAKRGFLLGHVQTKKEAKQAVKNYHANTGCLAVCSKEKTVVHQSSLRGNSPNLKTKMK